MTNAEAIEILEKKIVPCVKNTDWEVAVQIAISLMKKQIPKKPLHTDEYYPYYGCSKCKQIVTTAQNFCDKCGQAIDWSDKK